ncbi:MAG: TfoX/Sxy family protein [Hyphomicrobium sp.]|jgi:DNA transformation protein
MPVSDGYVELLKDLLADLAPITARRMFSGVGLFADGVMFALLIDDALYLKADDETRGTFEAEGLAPFTYVRSGRKVALSYWRAPERLLDDREEMHGWASRALAAARQASADASRRRNPRRRKAP